MTTFTPIFDYTWVKSKIHIFNLSCYRSCTLASRTDHHASVDALEPLMNFPMFKATNIDLINNIFERMKGNPNLDVEKECSPRPKGYNQNK